jgi:DNA-binding transcriptional regulator GbsR (MarR family)
MARKGPTDDLVLRMANAIGGVIEFWGFKRHMGRAWAVLYFSRDPLSANDLGERLSLSAGTVSMTMNDLLEWGVVKKTHLPGERRDYYEPEISIWKMVSRVFRQRELQQIQVAIESFDAALEELESQKRTASADQARHIRFVAERVDGLLNLARIAQSILRAILSGENVSALPIKNFPPDE